MEIKIVIILLLAALLVVYIIKKKKRTVEVRKVISMDNITGLGNDFFLEDNYNRSLLRGLKNQFYSVYFSYDYTIVVKYFGNDVSEALQKIMAEIIDNSIGDNDFSGRTGEGIFNTFIMENNLEDVISSVKKILDELNKSQLKAVQENVAPVRAGIYRITDADLPFEEALKNAKLGYITACEEDRNLVVCDTDLLGKIEFRNRIKMQLAESIENNEFVSYYQYIYNVKQNRLCSAECLCRWNNPKEGVLTPINFISDLQAVRMIDRLDYLMIEEACALLHKYHTLEGYKRTISLCCNVTRITISMPNFMKKMYQLVEKYTFDHSRLVIEITEDTLSGNDKMARENIRLCKKLGFKISLDDFGDGYSSFKDLCDYPIDVIKVDKSLVKKISEPRGKVLLKSLSDMAHNLGIEILYEGIETEEEKDIAIECGCDFIQGFYYSQAIPSECAEKYLDSKNLELEKNKRFWH